MQRIKKLVALTALMSLFAGQVQGQTPAYCDEPCAAYEDGCDSSYLSAALPIGALVVAAIIIATTNRHHHHHHSSHNSNTSTTSTTHAHFGPL